MPEGTARTTNLPIETSPFTYRCQRTNQRFFAYDSHGVNGIEDVLAGTKPDIMEIMPGIMGKIIQRFSGGSIPLIAGGLVETRQEVTAALKLGALAVSTGKEELWYD